MLLATFLIALVATAGAIPLCRNFHLWCLSMRPATETAVSDEVVPKVAGAGIFLGVMISLFYREASLGGGRELLIAGLLLVLARIWQLRHRRRSLLTPVSPDRFLYELAAAAFAGTALLISMPLVGTHGFIASLLVAMIVATPAGILFLARSQRFTPALPPGIALIQLTMLLVLGQLAEFDSAAANRFADFSLVALPTVGALLGAMAYLCSMPWRARASIGLDVSSRLCLGMLVAWGAMSLGLGLGGDNHVERTAAVVWILSPPLFEVLRTYVVSFLNLGFGQGDEGENPNSAGSSYSRAAVAILAMTLGGLGICLDQLQVPVVWSLTALLSCLLLYVVSPMLMSSWFSYRTTEVIDATRGG